MTRGSFTCLPSCSQRVSWRRVRDEEKVSSWSIFFHPCRRVCMGISFVNWNEIIFYFRKELKLIRNITGGDDWTEGWMLLKNCLNYFVYFPVCFPMEFLGFESWKRRWESCNPKRQTKKSFHEYLWDLISLKFMRLQDFVWKFQLKRKGNETKSEKFLTIVIIMESDQVDKRIRTETWLTIFLSSGGI